MENKVGNAPLLVLFLCCLVSMTTCEPGRLYRGSRTAPTLSHGHVSRYSLISPFPQSRIGLGRARGELGRGSARHGTYAPRVYHSRFWSRTGQGSLGSRLGRRGSSERTGFDRYAPTTRTHWAGDQTFNIICAYCCDLQWWRCIQYHCFNGECGHHYRPYQPDWPTTGNYGSLARRRPSPSTSYYMPVRQQQRRRRLW